MAKYIITLEDAGSGTLIDVQQDDSVSDIPGNEGARHLVLGMLFSAHALQRAGAGIARHSNVQPLHHSTKVH